MKLLIVVIATTSWTKEQMPDLKKILSAGINCISIAEELAAPEAQSPELAAELDDLAKERGVSILGTGVNPGFVLGPALDADIGTSLQALAMLLKGAYPAVPPVDFPVVDVRDLAAVHVAAMAPAAGGRRLIATRETWSMSRMGQEMRDAHPDRARKIPVGVLPAPVVRLMSVFDASLRTLRADLGVRPTGDSAETTRLTGVTFRPAAEAVRAASASLIAHGLA